MANPEHIDWLLEGVDSWNQRRAEEDFEPDLSGTDIYWEFEAAGMLDKDEFIPLSNINLSQANLHGAIFCSSLLPVGADLRHAYLWCANLKNANLANSRLNHADLHGADLCDANIANARLYKTCLTMANLTNANLEFAFLKKAELSLATLDGAILTPINLTGTNLESTQPWKAGLYPYNDSMSNSYKYEEMGQTNQLRCGFNKAM